MRVKGKSNRSLHKVSTLNLKMINNKVSYNKSRRDDIDGAYFSN